MLPSQVREYEYSEDSCARCNQHTSVARMKLNRSDERRDRAREKQRRKLGSLHQHRDCTRTSSEPIDARGRELVRRVRMRSLVSRPGVDQRVECFARAFDVACGLPDTLVVDARDERVRSSWRARRSPAWRTAARCGLRDACLRRSAPTPLRGRRWYRRAATTRPTPARASAS